MRRSASGNLFDAFFDEPGLSPLLNVTLKQNPAILYRRTAAQPLSKLLRERRQIAAPLLRQNDDRDCFSAAAGPSALERNARRRLWGRILSRFRRPLRPFVVRPLPAAGGVFLNSKKRSQRSAQRSPFAEGDAAARLSFLFFAQISTSPVSASMKASGSFDQLYQRGAALRAFSGKSALFFLL